MANKITHITGKFFELAPQSGIPAEVIAAIAGAVAAVCGPQAAVTSVKQHASKRASWRGAGDARSAWTAAGLSEVTAPFSGIR